MRIPVAAAIFLFVFSFLIDFYIYTDVRRTTSGKRWRVAYLFSAILCWLLLVCIMCMPRRSEDADILPIMWMLYTYLTIYVAKLGYVICSLVGRLIKTVSGSGKAASISRVTGMVAGFVLFASMWWGVIYTRRHIEVIPLEIVSPQIPKPFTGYKIAQISDLHVGTWGSDTTFVSELVDSVNALHPDLIVFTGDIVNRQTKELLPFLKTLSRLKAPDGVMSILGNHDYGDYMDWQNEADREENNRQLAVCQKQIGWDLLNNQRRFIVRDNDSIMVVGVENVGDPPFPTYGDLELALSSSKDSVCHQNDHRFKILLSHNPAHWDETVSHETNFGLTLSGHTHAMQCEINLFGWKWSPAKYRYEQWGGYYERINNQGQTVRLYVNIGAGEVGMPSRLFRAYPEITLITLEHQGS
ncbi:MAG: metallophosphoesterase [Muribaculaceae bacterium]|nr:metallophosphoesterase [Muribaculaceae bacterium]